MVARPESELFSEGARLRNSRGNSRRLVARTFTSLVTLLVLPAGAFLSFTGCSFKVDPANVEEPYSVTAPRADQVQVLSFGGQAIAGATVLFGQSAGVPFSANVATSDASGLVSLPVGWKQEVPVTVEAPGFVRATYLGRKPQSQVFYLRPARTPGGINLVGKTTGFGALSSNGVLDVSLVYPAIPRSAFGSLELTGLIGNGVDKVSVYGQELELPKNLSVPAQTEIYFGIVPVSLDKLQYQVSVPSAGNHRVVAVRAQFDFKKTVDELRAGKSFFDVINRFQFRSFASRDLSLTLPRQGADLPSDEVKLRSKFSTVAKGLPAGYAMLATVAVENQGLCIVTDVKRLLEGERRDLVIPDLSAPNIGSGLYLKSIKKYQPSRTDFSGPDFEEMSSVISTLNADGTTSGTSAGFYPILKSIATTGRSLIFSPPAKVVGVGHEQTAVTLSKVTLVSSGTLWLVDKTPIWDFYGEGQIAKLDLPSIGKDPWGDKGRYRWELLYSGISEDVPLVVAPPIGPIRNISATHFVKTATDFQVP